jgi:hypothetical protein
MVPGAAGLATIGFQTILPLPTTRICQIEFGMMGEYLPFLLDRAEAVLLQMCDVIDFCTRPGLAIVTAPTGAGFRSDAGRAGWRGLS